MNIANTYEDTSSGGGSGESGGGWGGGSPTGGVGEPQKPPVPAFPKVKSIFRNSIMTDPNWTVIEKTLSKIVSTSIGAALYDGLLTALGGKTLYIQFTNIGNSAFSSDGGILLRVDMERGHLLHEMFHAFQAYRETYETMMSAKLNMEIEAHFIQFLYQSNLTEYTGSKWERRDNTQQRWVEVKNLNDFINGQGNLRSGMNVAEFESRILNNVVPTLQSSGYPSDKYPLDYDRIGLEIFKNMRELNKNCEP